MRIIKTFALTAVLCGSLASVPVSQGVAATQTPAVAVGPQYDTTHVYVAPDDFDRFVASLVTTFGGTTSKEGEFTVTPTPSLTMSQLVLTPVGTLSIFGFKTPIPYPFGAERTGYLVTDIDVAVRAARAHGAALTVATFPDPIGRDVIIQWPGGVNMQLYWHTTAPNYPPLRTVPENRVYVSPDSADALQQTVSNWLRMHARDMQHWGREALRVVLHVSAHLHFRLKAQRITLVCIRPHRIARHHGRAGVMRELHKRTAGTCFDSEKVDEDSFVGRRVLVNQDADGFVPRGNLLVRRGSAVQFFARIELASKVLVDFLVAVSRGRLRSRPLR